MTEIRTFNSVSEFIKALDDEIARLRSNLGTYLRDMDDARVKAERLKKLEETLRKLGAGKEKLVETRELDLGGLSVVINPTPVHDLKALEDVVKSIQDRLTALENIRRNIEPLQALEDLEAKIEAYYKEGVPIKLFIKIE